MEREAKAAHIPALTANDNFAAACFLAVHEVSTDFIESEKVGRPCRFGQNLPLQAKRIQPENLSTFTSVQGRLTAAETSDRRKSRYNKKEQHTDSRKLPVRMLF